MPDKKTQKLFDNVTSKILQNANAKDRNISSTTGMRYEQPLEDKHPGLDLALMYAQPGNIVAKAFAPSMAKGFVNGLREGDLQQAVISGLVTESKVIGAVKKPISKAEKLGIPKGERSNPKALEDPRYWNYDEWNQRYNAAVNSGNVQEAQRLRDLHFKIKAPDTKVVDKFGHPLRTYHGLLDHKLPEKAKKFTKFKGVNFDLEHAVDGGSKVNHWKLSVPNRDIMHSYHTPDYSTALRYARDDPNMLYTDYLNIKNPFTWNEDNLHNILLKSGHKSEKIPYVEHGWWKRNYAKTVNGDFIRDTNGRPIEISSEWIPEKHTFRYPNVSDWSYFGGNSKLELMKLGYDGLYIPQYYDSYGAFVSPSQFKSAEPITRTDIGEIIPIVKRDNFHNLDRRYKQGGILKAQEGTSKVPTKREPPKPLIPVKETKPQAPQPLQPYESVMEKLKKKFAEMKKETKRPNTFGKFLITRDGTIVVEDGGKIA